MSHGQSDFESLMGALRPDYVVMLQAYFDESGTHDGALVTCVAGYVFESEQCWCFDREWSGVLKHFGLSSFHMSDCAHGKGIFSDMPKHDRVEVAKRLIGIIKRRARIGVMCSVADSELRQYQDADQHGDGRGYVLCLQWCLAGIAAWANSHSVSRRISYFFESGHKQQRRANEWMNILAQNDSLANGSRYLSHTFIGKNDALAIHAGDLLAWEWHREWVNFNSTPRRQRRASLTNLLGNPTPILTWGMKKSPVAATGDYESTALRTFTFA